MLVCLRGAGVANILRGVEKRLDVWLLHGEVSNNGMFYD